MAPREEDLYDALVEDVNNLRQLGKTWGLDDADIDNCFERAVKGEENGAKPRQPRKKRSRVCRCFGISVLCFVALIATGYCLVNLHKPTELFMMRQAQKFMYPIMRAIRHYSLPLRDAFDLSGLHEMECIISNPFYGSFAQVDCWPCENVKGVRVFSNLTNFTRFYYHSGIPLVVKDSNLSKVTFDDLKSVYLDNKELLHYSANNVQSSNHFITSIGDLFNPRRTVDDVQGTDLHVQWKVMKPGGVRLIRDISPKPYFVPKKAEVATEMFALIHAPAAEAHSLPLPLHPNAWVTQAYGSQEVTLTPVTSCKNNCTEVSVVLQPSDVCKIDLHSGSILPQYEIGLSIPQRAKIDLKMCTNLNSSSKCGVTMQIANGNVDNSSFKDETLCWVNSCPCLGLIWGQAFLVTT